VSQEQQLFTVRQVAARLQVDERIVLDWLERGELRGVHRGTGVTGWRVSEGALRRFIESSKKDGE
jgi:excisionase family DNA binding protein